LITIRELNSQFRSGAESPSTTIARSLDRIEKLNQAFNCFITVLKESATAAADASTRRMKEGKPLGPLDGIPVAVKDMMYIEGVRCTAGSKILANHIATYDSSVVRKLKAAGAVIVGTTNLHEFAAGVTSNNPHYGPVRNPWDKDRVAGGSSGGSAASVSLGMATCALGTDTAGSVRIPASLCGVVGLKPSYGRISRLGVIPLASSFDTVGTLTGCSWDAAALLQVLAGHDEDDITTARADVSDYLGDLTKGAAKARIGVPKGRWQEGVDPQVMKSFMNFIEGLKNVGCTVEDATCDLDDTSKAFYPIRRAEATAFHVPWLESFPELYGADVRRLLELGKGVPAVDYVRAQNARPALIENFVSAMKEFDAIAVPCTTVPAPKIGLDSVTISGKEIEVYSALNRLTLPFNVLGLPALSIPAAPTGGLPIGAQLVGRPFDESTLLRLGNAYEEEFGPYPSPKP